MSDYLRPPFDIDAAIADGTFDQKLEDWFDTAQFRAQERRAQLISDAQYQFAKDIEYLHKWRAALMEDAEKRIAARKRFVINWDEGIARRIYAKQRDEDGED